MDKGNKFYIRGNSLASIENNISERNSLLESKSKSVFDKLFDVSKTSESDKKYSAIRSIIKKDKLYAHRTGCSTKKLLHFRQNCHTYYSRISYDNFDSKRHTTTGSPQKMSKKQLR